MGFKILLLYKCDAFFLGGGKYTPYATKGAGNHALPDSGLPSVGICSKYPAQIVQSLINV